jgi:hypothetical protein
MARVSPGQGIGLGIPGVAASHGLSSLQLSSVDPSLEEFGAPKAREPFDPDVELHLQRLASVSRGVLITQLTEVRD